MADKLATLDPAITVLAIAALGVIVVALIKWVKNTEDIDAQSAHSTDALAMSLSDRDDAGLYHADGTVYYDGDVVDKRGLFLANGKRATFQDFTDRYYSEPPPEWAKRFPEYKSWKPSPMRWIDLNVLDAEKLVEGNGELPDGEVAEQINELKRYVPPEQVQILDGIRAVSRGLPTLNGYASRTDSGERCIILHAGTVIALTHLGTFISRSSKTSGRDQRLLSSLLSLATFIGSGGQQGDLRGALEPKLSDSDAFAADVSTYMEAIRIREVQLQWVVAHECAHHLSGHLEKLAIDRKRCQGQPDRKHFQLRRRLEVEADQAATAYTLRKSEFDTRYVDHLLAFMAFTDLLLNVEFDDRSTHPPSSRRQVAFHSILREHGIERDSSSVQWERFLQGLATESKSRRESVSVRLRLPEGVFP